MTNLSDFKVGSPIWGMVEADGNIGLRLDCGDGGILLLTPNQARDVIETLDLLLRVGKRECPICKRPENKWTPGCAISFRKYNAQPSTT